MHYGTCKDHESAQQQNIDGWLKRLDRVAEGERGYSFSAGVCVHIYVCVCLAWLTDKLIKKKKKMQWW